MKNSKGISESEIRIKHSTEVRSLSAQLNQVKSELEAYQKEHGHISVLIGDVVEAVKALRPVEVEYHKTQKQVSSPCSIVMQSTDSHYGMVQEASEIEGFGEYSPEISEKRQMNFVKGVLDWSETDKYDFEELVMMYTGDGVSGDIHDDLKVTNAFPVPMQAVGQGRIMAQQLMMLAPHFKSVRLEMIGADNHGRLTKKPQAKQEGMNNWNVVMAAIIEAMVKNQPNIKVNFHPGYEKVVNVRGKNYLMSHGHNLRGWMGIPFYSIERLVGKEAKKRMNTGPSTRFHKLVIGHFHAPFDCEWYRIGASCSGTDALDHKDGRESRPGQSAWKVHPSRGEFDSTVFSLS